MPPPRHTLTARCSGAVHQRRARCACCAHAGARSGAHHRAQHHLLCGYQGWCVGGGCWSESQVFVGQGIWLRMSCVQVNIASLWLPRCVGDGCLCRRLGLYRKIVQMTVQTQHRLLCGNQGVFAGDCEGRGRLRHLLLASSVQCGMQGACNLRISPC